MAINKILVVDDVATDRMHLRDILIDAGYQVIMASSGLEALDLASNQKPDLIFLDIVMDDMDGFKACRKLTSSEDTKHIPVVIVSANKQKVDKLWAHRQGARAYVTKPYTTDDITNQITKFR